MQFVLRKLLTLVGVLPIGKAISHMHMYLDVMVCRLLWVLYVLDYNAQLAGNCSF